MPDGSASAIDALPELPFATPAFTNDTCPPSVLLAVPFGVVTVMGPLVAPEGTVVVICVSDVTVNVAAVPLNATAVAPVKLLPVIVTAVPGAPLDGVNDVIAGPVAAAPPPAASNTTTVSAATATRSALTALATPV